MRNGTSNYTKPEPPKQYFYVDGEGKTQKYRYCTICQNGPFKQDEEYSAVSQQGKFIAVGDAYTACTSCAKLNGIIVKTVEREVEFYTDRIGRPKKNNPFIPTEQIDLSTAIEIEV